MAKSAVKTIGVLTSGGDSPAMNAAIRAVVRTAIERGLKVKGIRKGYNGLLNGEIIDMPKYSVSDTISRGGVKSLRHWKVSKEVHRPVVKQELTALL